MKRFNRTEAAFLIKEVVFENITLGDQQIYDTCRTAVYDTYKPTKALLTFMNYESAALVYHLINLKKN